MFCVRDGGGFIFPLRSVFGEKHVDGIFPLIKHAGNFLCKTLIPVKKIVFITDVFITFIIQ